MILKTYFALGQREAVTQMETTVHVRVRKRGKKLGFRTIVRRILLEQVLLLPLFLHLNLNVAQLAQFRKLLWCIGRHFSLFHCGTASRLYFADARTQALVECCHVKILCNSALLSDPYINRHEQQLCESLKFPISNSLFCSSQEEKVIIPYCHRCWNTFIS